MDIAQEKQFTIEGFRRAGLFREGGGAPPTTLRFFQLLAEAESLYGPRSKEWTFGGIVLCSDDQRPHVCPGPNQWYFLALTTEILEGPDILDWQLSHEVVHVLHPGPGPLVTVFEEGVAAYNAWRQRRSAWGKDSNYNGQPHERAFELMRPLIEAHPDGVRNLCAEAGGFSPLQPQVLLAHFPSASVEMSLELARPFYPLTPAAGGGSSWP